MPYLEKHLEFIQAVIDRQARNSFLIKGWAISLCTALAAFGADQRDLRFAVVLLIPGVALWCLDGYYLRQERLFRFLYDDARKGAVEAFDLSTDRYRAGCKWLDAMVAPTVVALHPLIVGVAEVFLLAVAR